METPNALDSGKHNKYYEVRQQGQDTVIYVSPHAVHVMCLIVAAITGLIISFDIQGAYHLPVPLWFAVNMVFSLSIWVPWRAWRKARL
jgi:hypothetical protein